MVASTLGGGEGQGDVGLETGAGGVPSLVPPEGLCF